MDNINGNHHCKKIRALVDYHPEITKGNDYSVLDEYRNPEDNDDLIKVTVISNNGFSFFLFPDEFE